MLYVGKRVVATKHVGVELDYACSGCGFASKVLAIGRGHGHGHDPFLLDTGADERASDAAYYAAHRSAREAVTLVRCPRCGDRDGAAWRAFWIKSILKLFGITLLTSSVGVVFSLLGATEVGWAMLVSTPILLFVTWRWSIAWRAETAEARVQFSPPRLHHRRLREPTAGMWFPS